jgi:vanadium chloroperoxidase
LSEIPIFRFFSFLERSMNPILYWHDVALEANRESHTNGKNENTGPTMSSRALALVHLAMHDVYFAINPGIAPYLPAPTPIPLPAATNAAIASAAYCTLSTLFPSQRAFFDRKLAEAPQSTSLASEGHQYGILVAEGILKQRRNDSDAGDIGYSASSGRFRHRPDPDNPQGFHGPFYGKTAHLFATQTVFELDAPPTDARYTAALAEVRRVGIKPELADTLFSGAGPRRSPQETLIGIFWAYDGARGLGTPPRLYNQIVRKIAEKQEAGKPEAIQSAQYARLLAFVNVAIADAGILAWREKYRHDFWRPVIGIREHDESMGPSGSDAVAGIAQDCDPFWLPLGAPKSNETGAKNFTPPFPAYPSGHATFGAAAFQITRLFYGQGASGPDTLCDGIEFVSDELNGVTTDNQGTIRPRHSQKFREGLWGAIRDNGLSRVYLGVHWVFDAFDADDINRYTDNIGGVRLGLNIAGEVFTRGLTPPV